LLDGSHPNLYSHTDRDLASCLVADPAGNLTGAALNSPLAVGVDKNGNLFVSQADYSQITEFLPNGVPIQTFGSYGSGVNQINQPGQILMDNTNSLLYVQDVQNSRVDVWTQGGHR